MVASRAERRASRRPAWEWLLLVLPTGLFASLALTSLRHRPLWRDETATREFARLSLPDLFHALTHIDAVLAPYYLLMHVPAMLPGYALGLRLPSAIAGIVCVLLITLTVRERSGVAGGLVAGTVLATNASFLECATTARAYALAAMFLAAAAFVAVRGGRRMWWILLAACAVLMQLFSILAVPGLALLLVRRHGWRRALTAGALPGLLGLALLAVAHVQASQVNWIPKSSFSALLKMGDAALGVTSVPVVLVICALGGLAAVVRRELLLDWVAWLAVVVVPPLALWVVTQVVVPVLVMRYAVMFVPGVAALSGVSAAAVTSLLVRAVTSREHRVIIAGVLAVSVLAMALVNSVDDLRHSYRQTASIDSVPLVPRFLAREVGVGDVIIYTAHVSEGGYIYGWALYARDTAHQRDLMKTLPQGDGWMVSARRVTSVEPFRTEPAAGPGRRTWLVEGQKRLTGVAASAARRCTQVSSTKVRDVPVVELVCP